MQRWHCPIHTGTLQPFNLVNNVEDIKKCLILINPTCFSGSKCASHFYRENSKFKIFSFTHWYIMHTGSAFKTKLLRELLWIGGWMECRLKWRLQSIPLSKADLISIKRSVSEFNEFKPRLKSSQNRFNWVPAQILKKLIQF